MWLLPHKWSGCNPTNPSGDYSPAFTPKPCAEKKMATSGDNSDCAGTSGCSGDSLTIETWLYLW